MLLRRWPATFVRFPLRGANGIRNLGQYELSAQHRHRYRHGDFGATTGTILVGRAGAYQTAASIGSHLSWRPWRYFDGRQR
jgi:hypothetical protein